MTTSEALYVCAPSTFDEAAFARRIKKAARHTQKLQRQMSAAVISGDTHAIQRARKRLLFSFEPRLMALYRANRRVKPRFRLPLHRLEIEARSLSVWRPTHELVRQCTIPKRRGVGTRNITVYGPRNRALHLLLGWAVDPLIRPQLTKTQFLFQGGRDAATRRARLLMQAGMRWVTELDIKTFHPSVNVGEVFRELGLPEGMGLAALQMARLSVSGSHTNISHLQNRAGLPQGASLSPLLGEFVVSRILRAAPSGRVVVFADNLLLVGYTQAEVEHAAISLVASFEAAPLGDFRLHENSVRRVTDGFTYLGYLHRRRRDEITSRPTDENLKEFWKRIKAEAEMRDRRNYARRWGACFPAWSSSSRFLQLLLTPLARGERLTQANMLDMVRAVDEPRFNAPAWLSR